MSNEIICTNCGVELDGDMQFCPLCGKPVNEQPSSSDTRKKIPVYETKPLPHDTQPMTLPQNRITWELMSVILLSVIITTGIINFSINKRISWSEVPIACGLVIFTYVSVFAFAERKLRLSVRIWLSFLFSAIVLLITNRLTNSFHWVLPLGIPMLFTVNLMVAIMRGLSGHLKKKGLNLIAYVLIASALFCLFVETILSLYSGPHINLTWSILVVACVLPVSAVLLFLHYRLKRGRDLKKTFHI